MVLDQTFIASHAVITGVELQVCRNAKQVLKARDGTAEEIAPLDTIEPRRSLATEMNHLTDIGVIPTAERHARIQVLSVNETKCLCTKNVIVVAAERV